MIDLIKLTIPELEAAVEELIQRQPGCPDRECLACVANTERAAKARELIRRRAELESAACAYIDRTANNSARDATNERAALIALLPELGPMVWSEEKGHYVRGPVQGG